MPGLLRKIQGLFTEGPPNFSVVDEWVAGSGLPSRKTHIRFLKQRGVTAIVSLTESPLPDELLAGENIAYLHFPLKDHQPPRPEDVLRIVEAVESLVKSERKVLIHCQAGYGRTGTVLAAYFMKKEGLSWADALAKVRSIRPGSVEKGQESTLMELEKFFRAVS
jgi:atypical dual specificity phosphatase